MSIETNIQKFDFTAFLKTGAFIREGGHCWIFTGPFQSSDRSKKQTISISYPLFYEVSEKSWHQPQKIFRISTEEFLRICEENQKNKGPQRPQYQWFEPLRSDYERSFSLIQNMILEGQIEKAVPVAMASAHGGVDHGTKLFWLTKALQAPEVMWPYGWWNEQEGLLGVTPEILFRIDGRQVQTMALAGTLAKEDGSEKDLLRSNKDLHEHHAVVADLTRQLSAVGQLEVGSVGILDLPRLWHLQTKIQLEAREQVSSQELLQLLHPTAALGVYPRHFGWRWMRDLPGQEWRLRLGAPLTFQFGKESALSVVAIRNIQWSNHQLFLGSGGGVVRQSELDLEWRELFRKRQSTLAALGMIE